jgi:hypothetical protein
MKRKNPISNINDYMNSNNNKKKMTFNDVNSINIIDNVNNNFNISQNNPIENINYQNKDTEIQNLKKELIDAKKVIEQQKITISNLEYKLNNIYSNINIQFYENIINKKEQELNDLKIKLKNIEEKNKVYDDSNKIKKVNFVITDKKLNYSVPCIDTDIFAEIEEKLYKTFPEYRETNNNFIVNGEPVLRFKTISQNNIRNGLPVTMVIP